ncbi:hypothetical protein [Nonlabens sp. YIK11]|uniref:hypothetical protein n=1 Tax=Nonlabens sp. YIK11 TaxID=1453349 RepID=UPI0006DC697E|nr:hypothetical protein [Nonlabens sp. YIK11]
MKRLLSLTAALLLSTLSFAQVQDQNRSKTDFQNETIYRVNLLLTPNLEIEKDVTKDISLLASAGVGIAIYGNNSFGNNEVGLIFPFQIELATRYYTNFNRRLEKGKTIENNSGNYVALSFANVFEAENDDVRVEPGSALIGAYGIQRTYWKHFNLNFQTGLGYDFQQEEVAGQLILKLGYTF